MGVCEDNVYHVERARVVPIFYQTFPVGNEHSYLVFAWEACFSADCRHCAEAVNVIPKLRKQSLSKTGAGILDIPNNLVLQFVRCLF